MTQPLTIQNITAHYGTTKVLEDLSLSVAEGELVSLLGASGCGKTTTLRLVAGFLQPTSGTITLGPKNLTKLAAHQRDIGLVFQNYALFPHLTVRENVAFGLKQRKVPGPERLKRASAMLDRVGLAHLADRLPGELSGGQKQRVALARALVIEPPLLMFDEPLSNLDAKLRVDMRVEIRQLQRANGTTALYVTHDQEEALEVSDRVVLMNRGVIEQAGSPQDVWAHPASPFVYGFLGDVNRFEGRADQGKMHFAGIQIEASGLEHAHEQPAQAYVRPHDLEVSRLVDGHEGIAATLDRVLMIGPLARLELTAISHSASYGQGDLSETLIEATISADTFSSLNLRQGDKVSVRPRQARVFLSA